MSSPDPDPRYESRFIGRLADKLTVVACVIGGGIAGLSTAIMLARAGRKVHEPEGAPLGGEATAGAFVRESANPSASAQALVRHGLEKFAAYFGTVIHGPAHEDLGPMELRAPQRA